MKNILSYLLLLPFIIWMMFQWWLIYNYNSVDEGIQIALNESIKMAAVQGRFTQAEYDFLIHEIQKIHRVSASEIIINATENQRVRGEYIEITLSVPKPMLNVMDTFRLFNERELQNYSKRLMSEWVP